LVQKNTGGHIDHTYMLH